MWHAFNWNGIHAEAPTKRDLLDGLAIHYGVEYKRLGGSAEIKRIAAGCYELTDLAGFHFFIYDSRDHAEADGFTADNYDFTEITFDWATPD